MTRYKQDGSTTRVYRYNGRIFVVAIDVVDKYNKQRSMGTMAARTTEQSLVSTIQHSDISRFLDC